MIYFGWSEFDPPEGTGQSIDPLRSLANSVALGELAFPGSSGRVRRIRYLSALCYLLREADLESGKPYRENYIKFRKFENTLILALHQLRKKMGDTEDFGGIVGMNKADQIIRNNPRQINVMGDIMSNQMNLGPIGQYTVFMRELQLIDPMDRELMLYPHGGDLAEAFAKNLGNSNIGIFKTVKEARRQNLSTQILEGVEESLRFSIATPAAKAERDIILHRLELNTVRKQLIIDVKAAYAPGEQYESHLISVMAKSESPLVPRYRLIEAYDVFQRILHNYFDTLLAVHIQDFQYSIIDNRRLDSAFKEVEPVLKKQAEHLLSCSQDLLSEDAASKTEIAIELRSLANSVIAAISSQKDFTTFLVQYHESHQKIKGRAPWVRFFSANKLEVNPRNILKNEPRPLQEALKINVHGYRFWNCRKMLEDMGLVKEAA